MRKPNDFERQLSAARRRIEELQDDLRGVKADNKGLQEKLTQAEFTNEKLREDIEAIVRNKPGAAMDALIDAAILAQPGRSIVAVAGEIAERFARIGGRDTW